MGLPKSKTTSTPRTILVTLTVDDEKFAPRHLQQATVSLSYDTSDLETVCNANTWWNSIEDIPPDDLTSLTHLHEPAVVYCLARRYQKDNIYTYTGKILLALNPFRVLDGLYGDRIMQRYWQTNTTKVERPEPHIYAIAQDAYRSMMHMGGNQSILVSGESGSGKTVTTKIIMGYLATLSQRLVADKKQQHQQSERKEGVESQILQSNPILESFGNARTVRNDNSSRFGKFMELLFHSSGSLESASIETYLLEKVRLISQAPGERNYHVFYELLAGVSQRERRELQIGNVTARDFRMTACSGTYDRRDGVDDRDTYRDLRQALDTVGFSKEDQHDMLSVACALLHTSNLTFRQSSDGEDASELVHTNPSLKSVVALLGVPVDALNNALCLCEIKARGEVFYKNMSIPQATTAVEALIKATYGALFTHIVQRINASIASEHRPDQSVDELARIGVLDIFGFESFDTNSFEQLCINYCNEALQQQFNRFVFKLEQQEYEREGIEWSFISFPDNQEILDLIEKRRDGILSILDEQCRIPRSTDKSFCNAVYDKCQNHQRFSATNTQKGQLSFSVHHYAGMVTYDATAFLEKNKDELPKETTELLMSSSLPFLASLGEILSQSPSASGGPSPSEKGSTRCTSPTNSVASSSFSSYPASDCTPRNGSYVSPPNKKQLQRGSSSLNRESVGSQFRYQLHELRNRIECTAPHYVRCLKPNDTLVPGRFEMHVIADQLRCAGVLEAIRVSRVGFPHRYVHDQFLQRYGILAPSQVRRRHQSGNELCVMLINSLVPQILDVLEEDPSETGASEENSRHG
jgi:myosin-5